MAVLVDPKALEMLLNVAAQNLTYAQCANAIEAVRKSTRPFDEKQQVALKAEGARELILATAGDTTVIHNRGEWEGRINGIIDRWIKEGELPATLPVWTEQPKDS